MYWISFFLFIAQNINMYAYIKNRYTHSLYSPHVALSWSSALSNSSIYTSPSTPSPPVAAPSPPPVAAPSPPPDAAPSPPPDAAPSPPPAAI